MQKIFLRGLIFFICPAFARGENNPAMCCRCINDWANCNNNIAVQNVTKPGLTCEDEIICDIFGGCDDQNPGCKIGNHTVKEVADVVGLKSSRSRQQQCSTGQKLCCNPIQGGGIFPLLDINQLDEEVVITDTQAICENLKLLGVQDFDHGVKCGMRDARLNY